MLITLQRMSYILTTCLLLLVGCEKHKLSPTVIEATPPQLQIAICDLNKIAEELGLLRELKAILNRQRTLLDNEIRKLQSARQAELKEKIQAYGEFPDDDQKRELAVMQAQTRQILLQAQTQASRVFAATQETLVKQIRTKIKHPVDQVATKKGIHIVYTASIANITTEVLSAARDANLGKLEDPSRDGSANRYQDNTSTEGSDSQEEVLGK